MLHTFATLLAQATDAPAAGAEGSAVLAWLWVVASYFIGSIPFGFLAGKLKGIDIRDHGSGNIGATNVLRTLGKPIGITVLILDILKGLVPVVIAQFISEDHLIHLAAAIAAILGHNFTCWLRFKGGKGIATSAGALLFLIPLPLSIALVLWVGLFLSTRYVSVASMAAAVSIPVSYNLIALQAGTWHPAVCVFTVLLAALALWRHRTNIRKLMNGTENRFTRKKTALPPEPDSTTTNPAP